MPLFSRRDGDLVRDLPAYRRIMPFIMRTKAESNVLFEQRIDATKGLEFIRRWNAQYPDRKISFLHLLVYALVQMLHERPRLNRFVMGSRHYQRRGIWISFSGKKAFHDEAPVITVKQQFDPKQSFGDMVTQLSGAFAEGKSDKESSVDKELKVFLLVPAPILRFLVKVVFFLDAWNLLPHFFIEGDPLYASAFIANLGSIKLDAAYHHLFEYGNIPIFGTIGKLDEKTNELILRWNYDERTEDGLYCARALELIRERLEAPTHAI
jgi:hypothetical protein